MESTINRLRSRSTTMTIRIHPRVDVPVDEQQLTTTSTPTNSENVSRHWIRGEEVDIGFTLDGEGQKSGEKDVGKDFNKRFGVYIISTGTERVGNEI